MSEDLPINPRVIQELAKATVKNLVDGIVELVTNCDDSYRRIEDELQKTTGEILIYVKREKGGHCKELIVTDFAEGMTQEELREAIEFAGETSKFKDRGIFGRGLKETILSLGEGEIIAIKNGIKSRTRIWWDKIKNKAQYDKELLLDVEDTDKCNGTEIKINVTNEKFKIPDYKKIKEQIANHYALRDINSSENRKVRLIFQGWKNDEKYDSLISFCYPEHKKILEKKIPIPGMDENVLIIVYESSERLDSPKNNPFGLSGILIKTEYSILDNQLFKFENEQAALYFFGIAICYSLEKRLRSGEVDIINLNRNGLEWRHEYSQALSREIEEVLEPLIQKKQKSLEKEPRKEVSKDTQKILNKLCELLNDIAGKEFEDILTIDLGRSEDEITSLVIKPEKANIPFNESRIFSIYSPLAVVTSEGREASIVSDNIYIKPLASKVVLEKHRKYPDKIWYRSFKVIGLHEGAKGCIFVNLGKEKATAQIKVAPLKKKKHKHHIAGSKRGFIADIVPDESDNPLQRVVYKNGIITIFVKFPSVFKFIKHGLEGAETSEGKLLLAELIGEAFCRELARTALEHGKYPIITGSEIDSYNTTINDMQKKYLHKIYDVVYKEHYEE